MLVHNFVNQTILSGNDNSRIYVHIHLGRSKWNYLALLVFKGDSGSTVVKVLWYKSEGRWFDPS